MHGMRFLIRVLRRAAAHAMRYPNKLAEGRYPVVLLLFWRGPH